MMWATVLLASAACYALKALGFVVPERFLDKPMVSQLVAMVHTLYGSPSVEP